MPEKKESIGRYKIKSRLGEGAAGIVYKVFDPVLQRRLRSRYLSLQIILSRKTSKQVRIFTPKL